MDFEFDDRSGHAGIAVAISIKAAAPVPASVRAQLSYAGVVIFECGLSNSERSARTVLRRLATPPLREAFRLVHSGPQPDAVRVRVVVRRRPGTEAEHLAQRLWPAPTGQPTALASITDLLELQRALVRRS